MPLSKESEKTIDRFMEENIHRAFDAIYGLVEEGFDIKPSEVAHYLNTYWDQGDFYREWWESDPEGEWS